ncbi:hypothetical protein KIW84_063967 [Lathyrus oleraceus]|uniref:Uncharacterized protein n=1 Tax=Pisum sativum TaxID=3888 RepID=A0A9D5A806_PEA|nr:hypothetical protein KIW84_063967 [Pisum sativum]
MAKICWFNRAPPAPPLQFHSQVLNSISSRKICAIYNMSREKGKTPQVLKIAVSGVTELLRLFSPQQTSILSGNIEKQNNEFTVSSVDDVLIIIKSDYDNAYFVTGTFFLFNFPQQIFCCKIALIP